MPLTVPHQDQITGREVLCWVGEGPADRQILAILSDKEAGRRGGVVLESDSGTSDQFA
jgi:hypothetical protein